MASVKALLPFALALVLSACAQPSAQNAKPSSDASGPSFVSLAEEPEASLSIYPIFSETGKLTKLLGKPASGQLRLVLKTSAGSEPVKLGKIRAIYRPGTQKVFPSPQPTLTPPPLPSPDVNATAGTPLVLPSPPASQGSELMTSFIQPDSSAPLTQDALPADLGWPTTLEPAQRYEVSFPILGKMTESFLTQHPTEVKFAIDVTLLNEQGGTIKTPSGEDFQVHLELNGS